MLDPPLLPAEDLVLTLLRPQQPLQLQPARRNLVRVVLILALDVNAIWGDFICYFGLNLWDNFDVLLLQDVSSSCRLDLGGQIAGI